VPEATHIRFVDEIPKTSIGKINKKQLRDPLV
jgi:non-ribosomal peptide synthetase component E (peptide arylation enzyme)